MRPGIALSIVLLLLGSGLMAQEVRKISISLDDDRVAESVAGFEEALGEGDREKAVFLGQKLIENELDARMTPAGFWPRRLAAAPGAPGLHIDTRYLIARRLASADPAVLLRYREILDDRATAERDRCRPMGPRAALSAARRFPLSSAGIAAAEEAAHDALESGNPLLAARLFGDLCDLDWRADDARRDARRAGLLLAIALQGDPEALPLEADAGNLHLGNRDTNLGALARELRAVLLARRPRPFGSEDRPQRLEAAWQRPLPGGEIGDGEALLPHPRLIGSQLVYHDRGGVEAISPEDGSLIWELPFTGEDGNGLPEMDDPDLLALAGTTAEGRYHFVQASVTESGKSRRFLVTLDIEDGRELWRFDPGDLEDELGSLLLDPEPLAVGDRLFVTALDDGPTPCCHVLALDGRDGRLLALTRLPPGVPLAYLDSEGEARPPRHWLGALSLRLTRGFLLVADDLGHVAALEADSLEPRFLLEYERRRAETSIPTRQHVRNRILVGGDRIVVAPNDSESVLALFLRPPGDARRRRENLLFQRAGRLPDEGSSRLLAFDGWSLVAAGRDAGENLEVIRSQKAFVDAPAGSSWSAPLDSAVLGEGFFDQKAVYLCTHKYVYATDLSEGAVFGPLVSREADGHERLGNLIAVRSGLIVASRRGLRAYRPVP